MVVQPVPLMRPGLALLDGELQRPRQQLAFVVAASTEMEVQSGDAGSRTCELKGSLH